MFYFFLPLYHLNRKINLPFVLCMKKYLMFIVALFAMTTLSIETASAQKKKKQEDVIVMAQFKGGQEALIDYLLQNTRYPREAMELEQTGEVVVEFVVESPECVEHISRNWQINDTVNARGRVRFTSLEEKRASSESSWGEEVPETTTRTMRELIITTGDPEGKEEEFAYDQAEIKKAFNVRKANMEQLQLRFI